MANITKSSGFARCYYGDIMSLEMSKVAQAFPVTKKYFVQYYVWNITLRSYLYYSMQPLIKTCNL